MSKHIQLTETFLFYDIPQVFAATDEDGRHYAGFLHQEGPEGPLYLLAEFTTDELAAFREGRCSLRSVLVRRDPKAFFSPVGTPQRNNPIPDPTR